MLDLSRARTHSTASSLHQVPSRRLKPIARNAPIGLGRLFAAPPGAADVRTFRVFRWNPDDGGEPRIDSFEVELASCAPMVLDALIKIKDEIDSTLAFRRSCREGVCGSCSMNVDGANTLACLKRITDVKGDVTVFPLPDLMVVKDLIGDQVPFFTQYASIHPWLEARPTPNAARERPQTPAERAKLDGLWECVLCGCCSSSCPSYRRSDRFLGPATLLQAYRWIVDSRDENADMRLAQLDDADRVTRCYDIGVCTPACPKGLDPARAIADIKRRIRDRKRGGGPGAVD